MKKLMLATAVSMLLAGCGGGGGSAEQPWFDDGGDSSPTPETPSQENLPPSISGLPNAPLVIKVRDSVEISFDVEDPDGDPVNVSLINAPPGVMLGEESIEIRPESVGEFAFQVRLDDGVNAVVSDNVQVSYVAPDTVLVPIASNYSIAENTEAQMVVYNDSGVVEVLDFTFDSATPVVEMPYPMPESYKGAFATLKLFEPGESPSYFPNVSFFSLPNGWSEAVNANFYALPETTEMWAPSAIDTGAMMSFSERRSTAAIYGGVPTESVYNQRMLSPHIAPSTILDNAVLYELTRRNGMLLWLNDYIETSFSGFYFGDTEGDAEDGGDGGNQDVYFARQSGNVRTASPIRTVQKDIENHVQRQLSSITWEYYLDEYALAEKSILESVAMPRLASGNYMMLAPADADFAPTIGEAFYYSADNDTLTWLSSPLQGMDASANVNYVDGRWEIELDNEESEVIEVSERQNVTSIVNYLVDNGFHRIDANEISTRWINDPDATLIDTGERRVKFTPIFTSQIGDVALKVTQENKVVYSDGDGRVAIEVWAVTDLFERWLSPVRAPLEYSVSTAQDDVVAASRIGSGWFSFYYEPLLENRVFSSPDNDMSYVDGASVSVDEFGWELRADGDIEYQYVVGAALPLSVASGSRESGHFSAWLQFNDEPWKLNPVMIREKDLCNTFPGETAESMCDPRPFFGLTDKHIWTVADSSDFMGQVSSGFVIDDVDLESGTLVFVPVVRTWDCDLLEPAACRQTQTEGDALTLQYSESDGVMLWNGSAYWPVRVSQDVMHFYREDGTFLRFQRLLEDH